jgi:hypothetical protein
MTAQKNDQTHVCRTAHSMSSRLIATVSTHEYQVRPRKDRLGVDLISGALPFRCALLSGKEAVADAIDYANLFSGSHATVIRVYNTAGKLIETHEQEGQIAAVTASIKQQAELIRKVKRTA